MLHFVDYADKEDYLTMIYQEREDYLLKTGITPSEMEK